MSIPFPSFIFCMIIRIISDPSLLCQSMNGGRYDKWSQSSLSVCKKSLTMLLYISLTIYVIYNVQDQGLHQLIHPQLTHKIVTCLEIISTLYLGALTVSVETYSQSRSSHSNSSLYFYNLFTVHNAKTDK